MATCLLRDNGVIMKYLVTDTATILQGTLELTRAQYIVRKHNLEELKEGIYRVINQVQFKSGEVIGFDGIPPKVLQEVMEPEQPVEVKPLKKVKEVD